MLAGIFDEEEDDDDDQENKDHQSNVRKDLVFKPKMLPPKNVKKSSKMEFKATSTPLNSKIKSLISKLSTSKVSKIDESVNSKTKIFENLAAKSKNCEYPELCSKRVSTSLNPSQNQKFAPKNKKKTSKIQEVNHVEGKNTQTRGLESNQKVVPIQNKIIPKVLSEKVMKLEPLNFSQEKDQSKPRNRLNKSKPRLKKVTKIIKTSNENYQKLHKKPNNSTKIDSRLTGTKAKKVQLENRELSIKEAKNTKKSQSKVIWGQIYRKTNHTYDELMRMCPEGHDPIVFLTGKPKKISSLFNLL